MANIFTSRIESFRRAMADQGIAASIVVHTDPHHSQEYFAERWQVREWLSGFTGSDGNLVVTANEALLWTDSRYFLQGEIELKDSGIIMMRDGLPSTPPIEDYLLDRLKEGDKLGVDLMLLTRQEADYLRSIFGSKGIELVHFDPIDEIWTDRPGCPATPTYLHDVKYSGETTVSRIERVMANVKNAGAESTIIGALDEIAWILNMRGSDVPSIPVFIAFLYLDHKGGSVLFIDKEKIADTASYLKANDISVKPYEDLLKFIGSLPSDAKVAYNPAAVPDIIASTLGNRGIAADSPVALIKACKNPVQINSLREALARDSVALVKTFMEIERRLSDGEELTEMDVAELATKFRSEHPLYREDSFDTICGYKGHGAIVHYFADESSNATIHPEGILLLDSGAQYLDGTTDITRTVTLGNTTAEERRDFTLVMKGHIALARAKFPEGTVGAQLDALARQFLWAEGKSYLHGTGHGVGFFLGVHEGPQSIRLNYVPTPLLPGMVVSNEPGIYLADRYGVRCENLILTVEDEETEFGRFFRFETLTLFPFDLKLFDTSIMTDEEIQWINDYHARCREVLLPRLNPEQAAWLKAKTEPLKR